MNKLTISLIFLFSVICKATHSLPGDEELIKGLKRTAIEGEISADVRDIVIRVCQSNISNERRDLILLTFTKTNAKKLSRYYVQRLIEAAAHTKTKELLVPLWRKYKSINPKPTDEILMEYNAKDGHISGEIRDVIKYAKSKEDEKRDDILCKWAIRNASKISMYYAYRLAEATSTEHSYKKLLVLWHREKSKPKSSKTELKIKKLKHSEIYKELE